MNNPIHPACGKTFPAGTQAGHCPTCCETFIGGTAFDMHRVGMPGTPQRHCEIQPYESVGKSGKTVYGHWADELGYWHYGKKATAEEKARMKSFWKVPA